MVVEGFMTPQIMSSLPLKSFVLGSTVVDCYLLLYTTDSSAFRSLPMEFLRFALVKSHWTPNITWGGGSTVSLGQNGKTIINHFLIGVFRPSEIQDFTLSFPVFV